MPPIQMPVDVQFVSIALSKIYPELDLPGDLYLFIGGKFIKFKNKGDKLDKKKFELFLYKKIQYVFVTSDQGADFIEWHTKISTEEKVELVAKVGKENAAVVTKHLEIKDQYLDFVTKEVTDEGVKEMLEKTRAFVTDLKNIKTAEKFLAQLCSYSQSSADHATNVANLSTFLAMNIGYSQQTMLETIYVGALLHDYGKTRISTKYLEDPDSEAYSKAMKKHPSLGKTALLLDSGFSDETLRIIAEHHERHDGKGYPRGLKGGRIYELTKIVSIANFFDNTIMNTEGPIPKRQKKAMEELMKDQGHMFDPGILAKSIRALEPVVTI